MRLLIEETCTTEFQEHVDHLMFSYEDEKSLVLSVPRILIDQS